MDIIYVEDIIWHISMDFILMNPSSIIAMLLIAMHNLNMYTFHFTYFYSNIFYILYLFNFL